MADPDQRPPANHRRLATALRDQVAVRRTIGDQVISLAHLRGRPVRDDAGTRVGRVSDIVVRQISVRGRSDEGVGPSHTPGSGRAEDKR